MRLVVDHSLGAGQIRVPCLREDCKGPHRTLYLSEALIDMEGPAFGAYYHKECVDGEHAPCGTAFCNRDHSRQVQP